MGFMGFTISLIIGMLADNTFITVVLRGLAVLVAFYLLGLLVATIGHKAVEENFKNEMEALQAAADAAAAANSEDGAAVDEDIPLVSGPNVKEEKQDTVAAT